jgi:DNA-binding CsgD family transcriptional regulator
MIVFNDGRYYQIIEDLECLKKWVTNVETSHIFCARNVTTYFDQPYNFTIWPEEPTCPAMEIYKEHGIWNGITVSKTNKDYTELYWFTKQNAEDGWHKWFIRNKQILLEAIKFFEMNRNGLSIPNKNHSNLFQFIQEFNLAMLTSEYIKKESLAANRVLRLFHSNSATQLKKFLSIQELKVLAMIYEGHTIKTVAQKLCISINTVYSYLERIRNKTGLNYKSDMIQFYKNRLLG